MNDAQRLRRDLSPFTSEGCITQAPLEANDTSCRQRDSYYTFRLEGIIRRATLSVLAPRVDLGAQPEIPLQPVVKRLSLTSHSHVDGSAAAQRAVELQDLRRHFLRQGPIDRRGVTLPLNERHL